MINYSSGYLLYQIDRTNNNVKTINYKNMMVTRNISIKWLTAS